MKPNAIHYKTELPASIAFSDPSDYLLDPEEVTAIVYEFTEVKGGNDYYD